MRRKIRWILASGLLFGGVVSSYTWTLPDIYESEVSISYQQSPNHENRVGSVLQDRLDSLKQRILTQSRLQRIILENNLYPKQRSATSMEAATERMMQDITMQASDDIIGLKYQTNDPHAAQRVTNQLASLFVEQNSDKSDKEESAQSLEAQIKGAEAKLSKQEEDLRNFNTRFMGARFEQQTARLTKLNRMVLQLQVGLDLLSKIQEQKLQQNRSLREQDDSNHSTKDGDSLGSVSSSLAGASPSGEVMSKTKEMAEESQFSRTTTDGRSGQEMKKNTPDAVRTFQLETREISSEEFGSNHSLDPKSSLNLSEIKDQINKLNMQIGQGLKDQEGIRKEMKLSQFKIDSLPQIKQQQEKLTKEYGLTKKEYQSLLAKRNIAKMSQGAEKKSTGEQFLIMAPASFPERPSKPHRIALNFLGWAVGLAFGMGLAIIREPKDTSIRSIEEIVLLTHLPVLASIPFMDDKTSQASGQNIS